MKPALLAKLLAVYCVLAASADSAIAASRPVLATPEQIAAERRVLKAVRSPEVRAVVAGARASLLLDPAARTEAGRAMLDHALTLWLFSLAFSEVSADTSRPVILWGVSDVPRNWFGNDLPGAGGSGDNPDNIYRGAFINGSSSYEIRGHIPRNKPVDFNIEIVRQEPGKLAFLKPAATVGKGHADVGDQVRMMRAEELHPDTDGNFVVTLGPDPADGRVNHIQTPPRTLAISFRNTLSDWRQVPLAVSIHRTDAAPDGPELTDDELASRIARDLPDWVRTWTTVKERWLGPPPPNTLAPVLPRDGGWGFVSGGQFDVEDDEALVVTTSAGGADYTGFAVFDRWYMGSDSRRRFDSLDNTQVVPNPDGTVTYVLAQRDPGVANWIDISGTPQGFMSLRWQKAPPGTEAADLVRGVKLVKLSQLSSALPPTLPKISSAERATALRRRAADYQSRLSVKE